MSPTSVCYAVTKTEADYGGLATARRAAGGNKSATSSSSFQFGIRKQENVRVLPLKVSKDSHRIRKPPLPLPQVQYRPPVIIHTYSPKVIHTQPDDFMSLVQKLTGSTDTRLRLKRSPSKKENKTVTKNDGDQSEESSAVTDSERRQGSGITTSTTNCGSPSSSEESAFPAPDDSCGGDPSMKQSVSPRGPLANYEFLNADLIFNPFDASPGNIFSQVKSEPSFSFSDNSFNFLTADLAAQSTTATKAPCKQPGQPRLPMHHDMNFLNIDINSPLPSPGFLSPGLDFYPGNSWSQSFLTDFVQQAPIQRQRGYAGGYSPSPEGTMVALENIQAFMFS